MAYRFALACASLMLLAGCVTDAPQPLSKAQVAALKIERVNVTVAPNATIDWIGGAREYAASKGIKPPTGEAPEGGPNTEYLAKLESITKSDEAKAFARGRAAQLVKDGVTQALAGKISGQQPARVEIVLKSVVVQNPMLRLLVSNEDVLIADATIVDAATGRPLASYPALTVTRQNSGGVVGIMLDPAVRGDSVYGMAKRYGERLQGWLLPT